MLFYSRTLQQQFREHQSLLQPLEDSTLITLYSRKLTTPEDVAKLTRQQIMGLDLDAREIENLFNVATTAALVLDLLR